MAKEKMKSQRSYDDDGYMKRAACVCVKNEHENEVLLISSNRNKQRWIIPGGGVENNEHPERAAEREVFEEAGVLGRLGRLLGVFENKERKDRTNVYLLIVEEELDEWEESTKFGRVRKWFYLEEAKMELEKHKPVQGAYLNLLKGFQNTDHMASRENDNINNNNNNNSTTTQNYHQKDTNSTGLMTTVTCKQIAAKSSTNVANSSDSPLFSTIDTNHVVFDHHNHHVNSYVNSSNSPGNNSPSNSNRRTIKS